MNARGLAMTEVLVGLLLTGVALTAAAALALGALAEVGEARRTQVAAALATDLAGRVRTLPGADWSALPAPGPCPDPCPVAQLAAQAYAEWTALLAAELPDSSATLAMGAHGGPVLLLQYPDRGGALRALELALAP